MFNFLFEGRLGDILAPVGSPTHQFHLSIQHQRNNEVQAYLDANPVSVVNQTNENGVAAIHVACRFNNMFAIETLLNRGLFLFVQIT